MEGVRSPTGKSKASHTGHLRMTNLRQGLTNWLVLFSQPNDRMYMISIDAQLVSSNA